MSSADDNSAHVGIAGDSRAAGDAQSGQHDERPQRKMGDEIEEKDEVALKTGIGMEGKGREETEEKKRSEMLRCVCLDWAHVIVVLSTGLCVWGNIDKEVLGTLSAGKNCDAESRCTWARIFARGVLPSTLYPLPRTSIENSHSIILFLEAR